MGGSKLGRAAHPERAVMSGVDMRSQTTHQWGPRAIRLDPNSDSFEISDAMKGINL